jgi:hypothetical protein
MRSLRLRFVPEADRDSAVNDRELILVSYYMRSLPDCMELIANYERRVGQFHRRLIVVDNAGAIFGESLPVNGRTLLIKRGSNSRWEFSGWLEGLAATATEHPARTVTLLNDSYGRNWEVTAASRSMLAGMYRKADAGRICGWRDNFSIWRPPRFSRRTNSRVVVLPAGFTGLFGESLRRAIGLCDTAASADQLFSTEEREVLERWIRSQTGRWGTDQLQARLKRIFIEHHLFDGISADRLVLFPRTYLGSLLYAAARHAFRERR